MTGENSCGGGGGGKMGKYRIFLWLIAVLVVLPKYLMSAIRLC